MSEITDTRIQVDLREKVALVVGGTGSIGEDIGRAFVASGARVVVASRSRNTSPVLVGEGISFLPVDVSSEESVRRSAAAFRNEHGRLDVLVLVHGVQKRKPFHDLTIEEWNDVIRTNLTGSFLLCKHFVVSMMERRCGKIVGITSLTSDFGLKNIAAYAASKGGMAQLLKSIAVELAPFNIQVNMVAPGRILTRMTRDLLELGRARDSNLHRIPMGRFGVPSDIAGAVLFLASSSSDYMTGQTIVVDGGWSMSLGNPED